MQNTITKIESPASQLKDSQPTLAGLAGQGKLKIVGAHYDLETGVVELLS